MAVPSDVVDLLNLSKEEAARTLAAECLLGRTSRLHVFLDEILKPDSAIADTILWCKVIVACGDTFEEFKTKIKEHDDGKICGLVWTANYVAFRCRTCSISPCMSLCEPCFRLGDHKGHDWNFFFSQAGGACDCGDVSVMKESGYCSEHGDHAQKKHATKPVPRKLICVSEEVMPKFLLRLVQLLRLHSRGDRPDALPAAEQFIEFLYELSGMGTPMRRVMAASMVDAAIYKHLVDPNRGNIAFLRQSHVDYLEAVRTLPFPEVPERFSDLKDKLERREHLTFLEELNFWIVKLEFPQRIVCFLLNLLTDAEFKEAMTNAFILHYSRVAVVLARSAEPDPLSNRVVHVSVQVFSNEYYAKKMTTEQNLLHVMVIGLRHMMSNIHMDSNLNYLERRKRTHRVIDCETQVMKDHCYWPLVSDLNNVLSHREVAFTFMSDPNLITEWFTLLSFFQGMNLNKREMEKHIEFEPSSYYAAFSAELEASAYPMWTMLSHLTEQNEIPLTKTVLGHCLNALEKWFVAIGLTVDSEIDSLQVSFHLPLHRFYAVLLCQAIRQGIPLKEIIPPSNTLQLILTHLLRIQVAYFEIVNNLWVRNGLQIKGQAMTYVQCNFSNSMVDADVFMLQVCLTQLEPSTFIKAVLKNFRANEWLSLSPRKETNISTHDEHQIMMESFFHFLTLVICSRSLMRSSDEELLQLELQTLLCLGEKTHSQLVELMPERCTAGQSKDFVRELAEIADFREPVADSSGTLQHGIYTPKPTVWEDNFDPVHVMLRAIQKKDYQTAMDNFAKYTQQRYKIKNPWPPYRLPRPIKGPFFDPRILANSRIMHATIFTVLVHALKTQNFPEQVLAPAIFMIEIAVDQAQAESSSKQICQQFSPRPPRIYDLDQENWFVTDNILVNLKTYIEHVYIPEEVPEGTVSAVSDCQDTEMLAIDDAAKCQMAVVPAGYPLFGAAGELVPLTAMSVFNPPESRMRALEAAKSNQDMTIDLAESPLSEKETRALPGTENLKLVRVCENMLSILLKLQARASGKADSFNPNDCNPLAATEKPHPASESRIGEGAFHIEKLLHKICKLDPSCRDFIIKLKSKLCTEENLKKSREDDAKKERTFLAEKHRKKMLEELANNSQKFMKIVGEMEPPEEDMEFEEKTSNTNQCTCAICSKSSVSTDEAPMGLVALVQTTHALRFSKRANALLDSLPVSDEDCAALPKSMENNLAKDYDDRFKKLSSIFGSSCQLTMDMSGKGGVHVQTCGHHIHIQCLLEYLESLKASTNKPTNISIEKGEFMCPMCRQLSNTVLPMAVESGDSPPVLDLRRNSMASSAALVVMHLENTDISESKSAMDTAMQRAMQDVVNCSSETWEPPKLDEQTLMVMTHSTLRTTLEIQIAQLGDTLRMPEESDSAAVARRACLVPFMQVLSYCTKSVATSPAWPVWQKVSGVILMNMDFVRRTEREVPILLQNPTALLIHLLLLLPTRLDHAQFTCIIKALYNLQYFQCLLQLMCSLHIEDISNCCVEPPWDLRTLNGCISLLMSRLPHDCMLWHKTKRLLSARIYHLSDVEAELQKLCLPFLRVAALLRHDIYGQDLPQIHPGTGGFVQLVRFLELYQGGIGTFDAATALNWVAFDHEPGVQKRDPTDLVSGWCQELLALAVNYASATCDLVHHHKLWTKPCLLKLPPTYDQIFKHYHKRECTTCGKVPHELCLCLFCAKTICLKGTCCRQRRFEAVEHSMTCGGGTGIFLVVPSSYIIVIRASRACLWGSVYLDSHGEDDRDLKRGKPLYLSQPRMNLLEQQWLTHKFDHINKRWVYHRDSL